MTASVEVAGKGNSDTKWSGAVTGEEISFHKERGEK